MAQPVRKDKIVTAKNPIKKGKRPTKSEIIKKAISRSKKPHPKYGSSKLEDKFAKEFLDKIGEPYERQFEAKDIGRFYDFRLRNGILIEIDGDFFHGFGLVYEEKSPMQKKNERVDEIKDKWAAMHGYRLYRIWEHDINEHPEKVREMLAEILEIDDKRKEKNKRH